MPHRSSDLMVVVIITILAVVLTFARISNVAARVIFALPLVLALPGYALTAATFPKRTLGIPERLVIGLGLSLIVTALGGLILNWTPWGLQTGSWAVLLACVTSSASAVAYLRRRRYSMKSAGHLVVGLNAQQGLLFGLAMLVAVGAIAAARIGASRQPTPGFTQLWILPADRPDPNIVRLGVSSGETAIMKYRLELKIGSSVVGEWMPIVKPGERWEATTVLPEQRSDGETVEAVLYRLDAPDTIYRRVVLWRDYQGVSK